MANIRTRRSIVALNDGLADIQVNTGDLNVSTAPYATNTQTPSFGNYGEGNHNIAAGQYRVDIYNEGFEEVTINGDNVKPQQYWRSRAFQNPATQRLDLTPLITIVVPINGKVSYSYDSPSA